MEEQSTPNKLPKEKAPKQKRNNNKIENTILQLNGMGYCFLKTHFELKRLI